MENTKIEWADHTFNPWKGCQKVSEACRNCYAATLAKRFGEDFAGVRMKTGAANWRKPVNWNRTVEQYPDRCTDCHTRVDAAQIIAAGLLCPKCNGSRFEPHRPRVFCASLSDVFEAWPGPISTGSLGEVLVKPYLDSESGIENWQPAWPENMEKDPQGWRLVTMDDVRRELFNLIDATPHLDWLLLTKRPENVRRMWPDVDSPRVGVFDEPPRTYRENVWIGTSTEDQKQADKRIPELLNCRDLSPVLFLSCEPLLGPVDLTWVGKNDHYEYSRWNSLTGEAMAVADGTDTPWDFIEPSGTGPVDWVIAGGESGPRARPSHPDWFRSLRDQCAAADVPFHFKQWGEWRPDRLADERDLLDSRKEVIIREDGSTTSGLLPYVASDYVMARVGKKTAGRVLDGVEHNGLPEVRDAAKH